MTPEARSLKEEQAADEIERLRRINEAYIATVAANRYLEAENAHYKERIEKLEKLLLSDAEREALLQLFIHGPTWDGDVISKQARTQIMARGLAWRVEGWTFLTELGVTHALAMEMDREKERRERRVSDIIITSGTPYWEGRGSR